jgi:hypothetical protein
LLGLLDTSDFGEPTVCVKVVGIGRNLDRQLDIWSLAVNSSGRKSNDRL